MMVGLHHQVVWMVEGKQSGCGQWTVIELLLFMNGVVS